MRGASPGQWGAGPPATGSQPRQWVCSPQAVGMQPPSNGEPAPGSGEPAPNMGSLLLLWGAIPGQQGSSPPAVGASPGSGDPAPGQWGSSLPAVGNQVLGSGDSAPQAVGPSPPAVGIQLPRQQGASPASGDRAPWAVGSQPPSSGDPAPGQRGSSPPGSRDPALAVGFEPPSSRDPAPQQWGSSPPAVARPCACWPWRWVLPRRGAGACPAPHSPSPLLPAVARGVGVCGGPAGCLRQARSSANVRGAFWGEPGERRAGSEKLGRRSRQDLSGHSAVPSGLAQAVRQTLPDSRDAGSPPCPGPAPGNAGRRGVLGSAPRPRSVSPRAPERSVPGSAGPAPVPAAARPEPGRGSVGSGRELPAPGETSGKLLRSCKKMGGDCHSPSDCHSLIISGQRGWEHSLSLPNLAATVVAIVAKD